MPYKSEESNYAVVYNGVDLTAYCTQADVEGLVREVEATNLASVGAESSPGSTDWTLKVSGLLEKSLDDVLGKDSIDPPSTFRNLVVTIGPSGTRTTLTWTGSTTEGAFVQSYASQPTESTQLITWQGEIGISGGPTRT